MASDGAADGRTPRPRAAAGGFKWVSSSPTPAEVECLEAKFSEVVRVPVEDLEAELVGWLNCAVIVRSFQRWVPPEAFIREFRRAGVSGDIYPISLAFKCHIFRFAEPDACAMVLNRPWVVNGQAIGTEAWGPEFFPSAEAVASALVWVRLPNLPMEFWTEDILRMILAPAGSMISVDAATLGKNRGAFARAAVRVDLRRPLRPGTRIQGILGTFWQQFVFECIEGICKECGSVHLDGSCLSSAEAVGEMPSSFSGFGPWMAAIRLRRADAAPPGGLRRSSPGNLPLGGSASSGNSAGSSDQGWSVPGKVARRRSLGILKEGSAADGVAAPGGGQGVEEGCRGNVPAGLRRAGLGVSEQKAMDSDLAGSRKIVVSDSVVSSNPFAALAVASDGGGPQVCGGAGPLKRARAESSRAPRVLAIPEKSKGKGRVSNPKINKIIGQVRVEVGPSLVFTGGGFSGQGSEPLSLTHPQRAAGQADESGDHMDVMAQGCVGDTSVEVGIDDNSMMEDQGGVPNPSS